MAGPPFENADAVVMIEDYFAPESSGVIERGKAVSIFDTSGLALRPWHERGFQTVTDPLCRLDDADLDRFRSRHHDAKFVFACPPLVQLSPGGSRWWGAKRADDPRFQEREEEQFKRLLACLEEMQVPYACVTPFSARIRGCVPPKASCTVSSPHLWGGYATGPHVLWPDVVPANDAYSKRLLLTTRRLKLPATRPVKPRLATVTVKGVSKGVCPLLSRRTKRFLKARRAPPVGVAVALAVANTSSLTDG